LRILHTYCLNNNIGDYALGIGLKNLLRYYLDVDLIGNTNIQGREFNKYYIREVVNKRYDLLVIGGGGIIHGAHWPNGWFWLIDIDIVHEIKIPFIVYGAGYNYWNEEGGIPVRGIHHLKKTIKHARYFSVRNDGSDKRLLEQTGIEAAVVPDPGFHVNLNSNYEQVFDCPYVIIQLANDKPDHRFGSNSNKERFIIEMREVTKELSKNYKVIFAPHVLEDVVLSKAIAQGIENTLVWDFGYFAFDHSDKAIGYYKYADFVIAMRGHGQIIPFSFNTPVISLENHPKHRRLMEKLGLLEYNVNIFGDNFGSNIKQTIEKVQLNKNELLKKYKATNNELWERTNKAFNQIKIVIL